MPTQGIPPPVVRRSQSAHFIFFPANARRERNVEFVICHCSACGAFIAMRGARYHPPPTPLFAPTPTHSFLRASGTLLLTLIFCSGQTDLFLKNPSRFADVARAHVEQHARQDASGAAPKGATSERKSCSPRSSEELKVGDARQASCGGICPSA